MKKVLLIVLGAFAIVIVGVLGAAKSQPDAYHIERSTMTVANPEKVYAVMCDLARFKEWSPFTKLDPNAKITIEGQACAPGQKMNWDGNGDAGAGSMLVLNVVQNERVDLRLEFFRPMMSVATTSWIATSEKGMTKITWSMDGENHALMDKVFAMMFMDPLLGKMFEDGLADLKRVAEAS